MEIQPLPNNRQPMYPTEEELSADQKLLEQNLPHRWQRAKGLAGTLALFLAANMTGCGSTIENAGDQHGGTTTTPSHPARSTREFILARHWVKSIYADHTRVYPVGDVVIPLPVTEDDASSIIKKSKGR
jgi:hypothetical protein